MDDLREEFIVVLNWKIIEGRRGAGRGGRIEDHLPRGRGRIGGEEDHTRATPRRRGGRQYNTIKCISTFIHVNNYYTLDV